MKGTVKSMPKVEPVADNHRPMTKRDLVLRISETTGLAQPKVMDVVQRTLAYITDAVSHGRKVEIRNFGVFEVRIRKARIGRNPHDPGADVAIPSRAVVKFKPGKEMRDIVMKLTAKEIREAQKQDLRRSSGLNDNS